MNKETGEIREATKQKPVRADEIPITIGDVVDIKGVPCKLVNVNAGKGRLTLTPVGRLPPKPRLPQLKKKS